MGDNFQMTFSIIFSCAKTFELYNFKGICSQGSDWQWVIIGSSNGLPPNRRQAMTWTNDDQVLWLHMASPGHNVWVKLYICVTLSNEHCIWFNFRPPGKSRGIMGIIITFTSRSCNRLPSYTSRDPITFLWRKCDIIKDTAVPHWTWRAPQLNFREVVNLRMVCPY